MSTHKDSFPDVLDPTFQRVFEEELSQLPDTFPMPEWNFRPSRWRRFCHWISAIFS